MLCTHKVPGRENLSLCKVKMSVVAIHMQCTTVLAGNQSSRKMRVLGQSTTHMVEIIQLNTNQPHTWLGFRHHPSSSVFQPYIWLDTISNSLNF